MATRSTIARVVGDSIQSIYVHFDGYPEGVGATLKDHYVTPVKITTLMDLGNLSSLGSEIGEPKDFDGPPNYEECLAYGRDRGEKDQEAILHPSRLRWMTDRAGQGCEYGYLWNGTTWETFSL